MKPVKVLTDNVGIIQVPYEMANQRFIICSDPELTESEIAAVKIKLDFLKRIAGDDPSYDAVAISALEKLLRMAGEEV